MHDISYWGMIPALSRDADLRNQYTSRASFCAGIGSTLASVMIPIFTTGDKAIGGSAGNAFATSVNHDTHNLIAFGSSDRDIASALNAVIEKKGGRAFAARGEVTVLGLPVGGLMSTSGAEELNEQCQEIRRHFSRYPLTLTAPFMTLSFLGLLVTPEIKIGEKGLFSFSKWDWVEQ
jgi:adenine deaminase